MQEALLRPTGNEFVPIGTPLHVRDLMLTLVKELFRSFPEDYPYRYTDDIETTDVFVDVAYNREASIYGKKPIIVIERTDQTFSQQIVGDLAAMPAPDFSRAKGMGMVQAGLTFRIGSKKKYEAEVLGQVLFGFLVGYRVKLPAILGVHSILSINLSQFQRQDQDDEMYWGTLSMPFLQQYHWKGWENLPVLSGYNLHVNR